MHLRAASAARLTPPAWTLVIVLMAACGSAGSTSGTSPTPVRSQISSPAPIWQAYLDPVWSYSINLPADWHEITNGELHRVVQENPALDKYTRSFINEAVFAATIPPLPLDDSGVGFTIEVVPVNSCSAVDLSQSSIPPMDVRIDGIAIPVIGDVGSAGGHTVFSVRAQVDLGRYCFYFWGYTITLASRDSFLKIFPAMLGSFQRGTPVRPPF